MKAVVELRQVTKYYKNNENPAVREVSFQLDNEQVLAVIGESGSGKTTLIRMIAGLEDIQGGEIVLHDTVVTNASIFLPPEKRAVGMVFQEYALFPHFNVYKNIAYGINDKKEAATRVAEVLELVGLAGYEERYPHELSGGQQQRIALARALAPRPKLLILDEPFSNLDAIIKSELKVQVKEVLKKTKTTAIFVTHDINDAVMIADRLLVMKNGVVIEQGSVNELIANPKEHYTQRLLAAFNLG
ncbi:ABC transporter [Tenacibaculum litopenaei]|jgi:iron(III) transport system ATP-binding protein|uniref:ABC transporter ATP-binding protein n=1 Tax=Tenacibaculum litopenaei TaxID=396016 RepID=UPI003893A312